MAIEIKKVPQREIFWLLSGFNVGVQANTRINALLGEMSTRFATSSVGGNFYAWYADQEGWLSRSGAPDELLSQIDNQWHNLCNAVRSRCSGASAKFAEALLTIPTLDYIFYRKQNDGTIEILITGWGFRNFKQSTHEEIVDTLPANNGQTVHLAFLLAGSRSPNRQFTIKTPMRQVPHSTDANGLYFVGSQVKPGTEIEVTDTATGKVFTLVVEKEKELYEFDVTEQTEIRIKVTKDGSPYEGIECFIVYHNESIKCRTNTEGMVSLNVPFVPQSPCTVTVGEQAQTKKMEGTGCEFLFAFDSPKQETPSHTTPDSPHSSETASLPSETELEPKTEAEPDNDEEEKVIHVKVVDANGTPFRNTKISLKQDREIISDLDENGECSYTRKSFVENKEILFCLPEYPQTEKVPFFLEKDEDDYLFEEKMIVEKENNLLKKIMGVVAIVVTTIAIAVLLYYLLTNIFI